MSPEIQKSPLPQAKKRSEVERASDEIDNALNTLENTVTDLREGLKSVLVSEDRASAPDMENFGSTTDLGEYLFTVAYRIKGIDRRITDILDRCEL